MRKSIKDILDAGLPTRYTEEVFSQKVEIVYQQVSENTWRIVRLRR